MANGKEVTKDIAKIADEVLAQVQKGKLDDNVRAIFADVNIDAMKALGADHAVAEKVGNAAKAAHDMATKINATGFATDTTAIKEVQSAMVGGGELATKLLSENEQLTAYGVKDFNKTLGRLQTAYTEVKGLLDAPKPDVKKIESALLKHRKYSSEVIDIIDKHETGSFKLKLSKAGVDLAGIEHEVGKTIKKGIKEATSAMAEHKAASDSMKPLKPTGSATKEELETAEKLVADAEKKFVEHTKGEYGSAVFKGLKKADEKVLNEMLDASKVSKAHHATVTKVVAAGEKAVETGRKFWQKTDVKALEEMAGKAGVKIGELPFWKSSSLGAKALVVGVPVGIVSYLATAGNKTKTADMNAEAVQAQLAAQQQPEVAAGMGR